MKDERSESFISEPRSLYSQDYIGRAVGFIVVVVLVGGFFLLNHFIYTEKQGDPSLPSDYKNATYVIDGRVVTLTDGYAEEPAVQASALKITTRYFGNELTMDLDGDGESDDVAFIVTQETGGSGIFFYAVAAVKTEDGYVGSDGYLLGDRVAPQSTNVSQNPRHRNVAVFNYADRERGEAMAAVPTIGKSAYLKLDVERMQWGIVEPDFEGESR